MYGWSPSTWQALRPVGTFIAQVLKQGAQIIQCLRSKKENHQFSYLSLTDLYPSTWTMQAIVDIEFCSISVHRRLKITGKDCGSAGHYDSGGCSILTGALTIKGSHNLLVTGKPQLAWRVI